MSRIGYSTITIPSGVSFQSDESGAINVTGPKGELTWQIPKGITVKQDQQDLSFERNSEDKPAKSLHGLTRAVVNNMIEGVSKGFSKKLIVEGVGFKVNLQGKKLVLALGLSHDVEFTAPEGVDLTVEKNDITINGIDKQLVGQVAANIRKLKKPEPYKGKGIRYENEYIIRKEGKTAGS